VRYGTFQASFLQGAPICVGCRRFLFAVEMLQISALPETALPAAYKTEKIMFLGLVMMVMSFPAGLLWWIFLVGVYELHPSLSGNPQTTVFTEWAGAFVLGYLQWFWLIPLYKKKAIKPA
jgi:hypothetical protein